MDKEFDCPCCSGKTYQLCCSSYHQGKREPDTALALMRSRYSAYALNNADYILRTTHPRHPRHSQNVDKVKQEIMHFSLQTDFQKLEIVDFKEQADKATVVFIAYLEQNDRDATFTEKSFFSKVNGHWLYVNGDVYPGVNRDLTA